MVNTIQPGMWGSGSAVGVATHRNAPKEGLLGLFPLVASRSESADGWGSSMITQYVSGCKGCQTRSVVQEVTHGSWEGPS